MIYAVKCTFVAHGLSLKGINNHVRKQNKAKKYIGYTHSGYNSGWALAHRKARLTQKTLIIKQRPPTLLFTRKVGNDLIASICKVYTNTTAALHWLL